MDDLLVKKGETILNMTFKRSTKGLIVKVKAHPMVEEYFESIGGRAIVIENFGRHWTRLEGPEAFFINGHGVVDSTLKPVEAMQDGLHLYYSLCKPGLPLLDDQGGGPIVNLGFLRIAGVSKDTGIAFTLKGVFTEEWIRDFHSYVQKAMKKFFRDYLKSVTLKLTMVTEEVTIV